MCGTVDGIAFGDQKGSDAQSQPDQWLVAIYAARLPCPGQSFLHSHFSYSIPSPLNLACPMSQGFVIMSIFVNLKYM